jgi:L-ornithine N5-oxygenase
MKLNKELNSNCYDVLGIGFGPANIALAIALEELMPSINVKFFEMRERSMWQPEMLIDRSDIQNNPLRDLVTPRNPRSKYTFINYLYEQGRLFEYLNLGIQFPLRKEYAYYIEWVANQFHHWVEYNQHVASIEIIRNENGVECVYLVTTNSGNTYTAKALVIAPGRTPYIPAPLDKVNSNRIFHLTKYLSCITKWKQKLTPKRIAVVGSSQSAVELILDLSKKFSEAEIVGIVRSFGYRLKDTSPFTGEVYFPEFVDYYYYVDRESKDQLNQDLRHTNYSSVDRDVLNELYLKIYDQKLDQNQKIFIKNNRLIIDTSADAHKVALSLVEKHLKKVEVEEFDLVILATGFRNLGSKENEEPYPPILKNIKHYLCLNDDGYLHINHDYSVNLLDKIDLYTPLFVNGLCESSHGMGDAGSFSLLSLRSAMIVERLKRSLKISFNASKEETTTPV